MSKATKRLENFLEKFTRKKYFQDRVTVIRKKIGLPENGIPFPGTPRVYTVQFPASVLGISYKGKHYPTYPAKMEFVYNEILTKIPKVYKVVDIILFINIYILYNERHYEVFEETFGYQGTVTLVDYRYEYLEMEGCCDSEVICANEQYAKGMSEKYPIMIGISPYATQNEVTDFVKQHWNYIQTEMEKLAEKQHIPPYKEEKILLSRIRKRTPKSKRIEDTVYKNRELSLKEIADIVNKETGELFDQGEIGKLRNLAIKRR